MGNPAKSMCRVALTLAVNASNHVAPAVAARAKVGSGTVIAVSDPSIIITSMVGRGDNEKFLTQIISQAGESPQVALDISHLPEAPLDSAKNAWTMVKKQLTLPYSQALLVGAVLTLSFMPVWRKGVEIER